MRRWIPPPSDSSSPGGAPAASPPLAGQGHGDTVEQGRTLRAPRSRRTRVLMALLVPCLVLAGAVLDHRVRDRESGRVDRCVEEATASVRFSSARVDSIVSYVRPALGSPIPASLRTRLHGLVSVSVAPVVPGVRRARDLCREVHVLTFHQGLRATRADCLRLLDRDLSYLRAIVADGSRALGTRVLAASRCTRP